MTQPTPRLIALLTTLLFSCSYQDHNVDISAVDQASIAPVKKPTMPLFPPTPVDPCEDTYQTCTLSCALIFSSGPGDFFWQPFYDSCVEDCEADYQLCKAGL